MGKPGAVAGYVLERVAARCLNGLWIVPRFFRGQRVTPPAIGSRGINTPFQNHTVAVSAGMSVSTPFATIRRPSAISESVRNEIDTANTFMESHEFLLTTLYEIEFVKVCKLSQHGRPTVSSIFLDDGYHFRSCSVPD